jgi:hypothetical protein
MGIRVLAVQTFLPVAKLQQLSWLKKLSKVSALFSLYKCRQWAINKSQAMVFMELGPITSQKTQHSCVSIS